MDYVGLNLRQRPPHSAKACHPGISPRRPRPRPGLAYRHRLPRHSILQLAHRSGAAHRPRALPQSGNADNTKKERTGVLGHFRRNLWYANANSTNNNTR